MKPPPRLSPLLSFSALPSSALRPGMCLLPSVVFGFFTWDAAQAQLLPNAAVPAGQRPVLLRTMNGLPQVDITRPSVAGVSVNQFSQFDIDPHGAIINNGRQASPTALAGWVAANPSLQAGEASVIVNEIRSKDSSQLQGYIEVAGGKAALIIANPAGIRCNGCGFLHASRVELATAKPVIADGRITGYTMGDGMLEFAGRGLDATGVDSLSLLTQAARINAGIWAKDLRISLQATVATGSVATSPADSPTFALDVAHIGGMYAQRIWLVGTAQGLGARNGGTWSARESLTMSMNGKLENSGSMDAPALAIQATTIDNVAHGKLLGTRIALQADRIANVGHPDASPVIAAAGDMDIAARVLENTDHAVLFAGGDLRIGLQLDAEGHAIDKADRVLNRAARIESRAKLDIAAALLENLNAGVTIVEVPVGKPKRLAYVQPEGERRKYAPDELKAAGLGKVATYSRTEYIVDRTEFESRVTGSAPAQMVAGSDLRLTGDDLLNHDSQITATGKLSGTLLKLRNIETPGTKRVHETGTSQFIRVMRIGRLGYKQVPGPVLPYAPADTLTTLRLPVSQALARQGDGPPPSAADPAQVVADWITTKGSKPFWPPPSFGPPVETESRFVNYQEWLASQAMPDQQQDNKASVQREPFDAYLAQQQGRDPILPQLAWPVATDLHQADETYAAWLLSGVTQVATTQLAPGMTLTAEQVAKLTSDIVWLVDQDISEPARSRQVDEAISALVPRVYLLPKAGDLDRSGALISATRMAMSVINAIDNTGTMAGTDGLWLQAGTINNGGLLEGDTALLIAADDIDIHGGEISTRYGLSLQAGRDIRAASSIRNSVRLVRTRSATSNASRTGIGRLALLHVNDRGNLRLLAGRDIKLDAAKLRQQESGEIAVVAGRELYLGTLTTRSSTAATDPASANYLREAESADTGTSIEAKGSIALVAAHDLAARAAHVESTGDTVALSAAHELAIAAGEAGDSFATGSEFHQGGFLGTATSTSGNALNRHDALASVVSGNAVVLNAGQDLYVSGSDISGDNATRLQAGRDLTIDAATQSRRSTSFNRETRSGLLSGPGLSISIGKLQQQQSNEQRSVSQRGSLVGSQAGGVSIGAGNNYRQQASQIIALSGPVNIAATNVDITGGQTTYESRKTASSSQSGVAITLSNPVIDTSQSLKNLNDARQSTHSDRAKALAAAASVLDVANVAKEVTRDPAHAGGLTLAATIGSSKAESITVEQASTVAPSLITANGNINIRAQDGPQATLSIVGSRVSAGEAISLQSDGKLALEAQANTATHSMVSHGSGTGVGVAASIGKGGAGIAVSANARLSSGKASGNDVIWTNTEVTAGRQASLRSKGNTLLKGASVKAHGIDTYIGGHLRVESLQDSSHYESRQQSNGVGVTIPLVGASSPSAQLNAAGSGIHSNDLSTTETSSIEAGDGGFQVQVAGNTELKGAAIVSSDAAVDAGTNQFSSAALAISDLTNRAGYQARSAGIGIGLGSNPQGEYMPKGSNAGLGSDSGHQASVTSSGISGIAGNKSMRSGAAPTGLNKIFDAERVAREINAQMTISQEFSGQAYKAVDDFVNRRQNSLQEKLKESKSEQEQQAIHADLIQLRRESQIIHILIGAAIGMGSSAVTKESLSAAAESMRTLMIDESRRFPGITDGTTTIANTGGTSAGVRNDGFKLGGTRIDIDLLCGRQYERCKVLSNDIDKPILDQNGKAQFILDAQGNVQFDVNKAGQSLQVFLESAQGKDMYGTTGGIQGYKGTLFGISYEPGSWQDRLIEAFSGTHDVIGGKTFGLYDAQGNVKQGMSDAQRFAQNIWSGVAILPSSPFAAAELLPPSVWQAIATILQAAR